jgi:hypothetical protein
MNLRPVKIWATEDIILKHFFQIIQTKALYLDVNGKGVIDIIGIIGSEEELIRLANIINCHVDGATELKIFLLYCGYDPLYELCKSKEKDIDIQLEMKKLEYKFLQVCNCKSNIKFDINTASNQLCKDELATEKIISAKNISEQRQVIINCMKPSHFFGSITFCNDNNTDAVYFDQASLGEDFISCVTLPLIRVN